MLLFFGSWVMVLFMNEKIHISNEFRSLIIKSLHNSSITHTQLAIELKKTKGWVSQLISGRLKTLKSDDWDAITKLLKIEHEIAPVDAWPPCFYLLRDLCLNNPTRIKMVQAMVAMFQEDDCRGG